MSDKEQKQRLTARVLVFRFRVKTDLFYFASFESVFVYSLSAYAGQQQQQSKPKLFHKLKNIEN